VKANELELAVTVPDDLGEEDPDPARVATRALVVGSTVVGVDAALVGVGAALVGVDPAFVGVDPALVGVGGLVMHAVAPQSLSEVVVLPGASVVAGATVGVVGPTVPGGPTVVGGTPVAEVAIVGDIGEPEGPRAVMPVGELLLGYAVQERARALPDTSSVSLATLS
jgi:hypothetical protein